MALMKERV